MLLQLVKSLSRLCKVTASALMVRIVNWTSCIRGNPSLACLTVIEHYIRFALTIFPTPIDCYCDSVRSNDDPSRGIPMLRPTQDLRKLLTIFVHAIVMCRQAGFMLVFHGHVKVTHNGMFTTDSCLVATLDLTALTVTVIWFKTWQNTDLLCWLHNSYCRINWGFSGNHRHGQNYRH